MNMYKKIKIVITILVIAISFILIPLNQNISDQIKNFPARHSEFIHSSAETVISKEWLKNNDFSTQDEWFYSKGALGDNSSLDASIGGGNADYIVVGEDQTKEISAPLNDGTWVRMRNDIFLYPDTATITSDGCYVDHQYDESVNQTRNYHSVHWKKNVSMGRDMSKFNIDSASLEAIFNATVDVNVDVENDNISPQFGIGDFATFYVLISDLDFTNPYRVANNVTSTLGQDSPPITTITDKLIETVDEEDIITAISSSLDKDPDHSNFTITLGIDIYCEDNFGTDRDYWDALRIKSLNLTFSYKRKVEKFSSVSWNQVGNTISGTNIHVSDANLKFRYRIDQNWPSSLSPYSEIRIIINNNQHPETLRLSSATTLWDDAKAGGFDVTNLIEKEVNISVSLQVFIANTFSLDDNITVSIDEVYLNITYVETFADYGTESQLFLESINKTLDPFIQVPLGNTVNITIKYLDNQTGTHISGANVELSGKLSGSLNENGQQYSRVIDTTNLGIGVWSLTVTAQKSNYEIQPIYFFIRVLERATDLQMYVDDVNKTLDNTFNIIYNRNFNITIFYRDDLTNQHLSDANVSTGSYGDLIENNEQYTITLNSTTLTSRFNVLTITAQSANYTTREIQLFVEVYERATEFELLVNGAQETDIQIEVNQVLNLTVFYRDDITKAHLSGAVVSLLTIGNFTEIGNQYNYSINSNNLSLDYNVLSISARFGNYQSQTIQIYVEVYEIASNLTLLIDNEEKPSLDIISVEVDQFKNLTVYFKDNITEEHISGAIVSIDWVGFADNFTEIGSQYYFNLDTDNLTQVITIITIKAQVNDYQSQTMQIYFEVGERDTEIEVLLDDDPVNETQTIERDVNQIVNITVFYRDNVSKSHLSGANATLHLAGANITLPTITLDEIGNQFNVSLNTNNLTHGITILTVVVYRANYQPRSFQFYIKVSERESDISLFLDSNPTPHNPLLDIPFRSTLNITIQYFDNQTKKHITGADVQLVNKTNSEVLYDFEELLGLNQYTLILDTSDLTIGGHLLEIVAWGDNYQIKTSSLTLILNKIAGIIDTTSGESYFSILPSESITLSVTLTDSDFNQTISGAIVIYRWAYGQGTLTDPDLDGNYTVELENVPAGTYEIIISASVGDDYSFNIYRITLNVVSVTPVQPDFSLLFISLAGGLVVLVVAFTLYEVRFKYPPLVRKSRKIRKKISKGKKTKPIKDFTSRDDLIKEHLESNVESIQLEKKSENGLKEK